MKQLRSELTADGRLDILGKVMAYRGGTDLSQISTNTLLLNILIGYSPKVGSLHPLGVSSTQCLLYRTVGVSSKKRFLAT